MADKKKTFVMYESWGAAISMMNNEQAGALLKAIYEYQNNSSARPDDPSVAFVFEIIRQKMDDDQRKYEETCQTRSEAGRKGNDKRWSESQTVANGRKCDKESQSIAKDRKCDFCDNAESQTVANVADNDNESDNDTESDTDNDSVSENDNVHPSDALNTTSAEPKLRADVEALPLNDGSEWRPTVDEYDEYARLYPAVDIADEFRKMRGWCIGNPGKRKTIKGIRRFVTSWLGKEQDRGRPTARSGTTGGFDADAYLMGIINGEGDKA